MDKYQSMRLARWSLSRFLLLMFGAIFVVERTVMLVVHLLLPADTHSIVENTLNASLLALFGGTILWFIAFRPLHRFARATHLEYKTILDNAADAIVVIDESGTIETFNVAAEGLFGYTSGEIIGRNVSVLTPSPHREAHDEYMHRFMETGEKRVIGMQRDLTGIHKAGSDVPIRLNVGEVWTGRRRVFVGVLHDISERVRHQREVADKNRELTERHEQVSDMAKKLTELNEQLARDARTDRLTTLFNHGTWHEAAAAEHERVNRHGGRYAVLMMDIDYFKAYNDALGHQLGDESLRVVASRIASGARTIDTVGRYGGEEFILLAPETTEQDAVALAERVRGAIADLAVSHPNRPDGEIVTISIGVAESGDGSLKDTIRRADDALYAAKSAGRNRVCRSSECVAAEA